MLRPFASLLLVLASAACGSDGVTVRGTVDPSVVGAGEAWTAWTVWAEEAEREASVNGGSFELGDLAPGPVNLQLRQGGRTVGRIALPGLPAGAEVALNDLRVDRRSGRAFPASVQLDGAEVVWVNGVRMAPEGSIPDTVDVRGAVLALDASGGVMLFRPDDARLPDLRVLAPEQAAPLSLGDLEVGDSLRVAGRRVGEHVAASLLEPAGGAATGAGRTGDAALRREEPPPGDPGPADDASPASIAAVPTSRPAVAPREGGPSSVVTHDTRGHGGGEGKGRGRGRGDDEKGRGQGRGNKKEKG